MSAQNTYQTSKNVMTSCEPNQFSLMNKVQLMVAFDPTAGDLYERVKCMKVTDAYRRSLSEEVRTLNTQDFQMIGQLLNLFRI